MSRKLKAIERKINETITDLCGYMQEEKTFTKDVRCIYIPIINNLEEALSELQDIEVDCLTTFKEFKKLGGCRKYPEENKEESND